VGTAHHLCAEALVRWAEPILQEPIGHNFEARSCQSFERGCDVSGTMEIMPVTKREAAAGSGPALLRWVSCPRWTCHASEPGFFQRSLRVVRIRMKSFGRRHRPFYRICAMDARSPRDGRAIEELGHYDPMVRNKDARTVLNASRIRYWLSVGAQPSEKVQALLNKAGIVKPAPGEHWQLPEAPAATPAPAPAAAATTPPAAS